jgi:hypothetical protein
MLCLHGVAPHHDLALKASFAAIVGLRQILVSHEKTVC